MLMYISFFIMTVTCLIGIYTISTGFAKWFFKEDIKKSKDYYLLPVREEMESLEIFIRNALHEGNRKIIIADCGMNEHDYEIARRFSLDDDRVLILTPNKIEDYLLNNLVDQVE